MSAEEKPALLPLPLEPFRMYQFGDRRVNLDGCVEVDAAYYSAPPGWIGRSVNVQWDGHVVRVLDPRTGQLLREHHSQERGKHRIPDEDKPTQTPRSTSQLLARCGKIGPHVGTVAEQTYRRDGPESIRRIMGLTGLARKHRPPCQPVWLRAPPEAIPAPLLEARIVVAEVERPQFGHAVVLADLEQHFPDRASNRSSVRRNGY